MMMEIRDASRYLHTNVHSNITSAKRQKELKCLTDEWDFKKINANVILYSALNRDELMTYAKMWVDLEDAMLNKNSQTQNDSC